MKKTERFYFSLFLLIFLNGIIKPVWIFAIDRQVQNHVGIADYGQYFSLFNLSVIFTFLLDLGLTVYFSRQLAIRNISFDDLAGNFLLLRLLLVLVYLLVVFSIALFTGVTRWDIVAYTALIQIFSSLFVFFRSLISAHQWFRADAWLSVLDKTLMIVLCGILLYLPSLLGSISIERFLVLQFSCLAAAMFSAWAYLSLKGISFTPQRNWMPDKTLFRKVLPFGLIILLMSAHSRIDAFLLERIKENGAYEAGLYAAAYRLLDAANMVGFLAASFLLPYIARQWSEQKDITPVVLHSRHFLLMFSIGIVCVIAFLAPWIQQVLYHHQDENEISILQWCLPALIGYSLTQVYGTALTATGHITPFCYLVSLFLLLNIILNLILIPLYGAKGCCISALISQISGGITIAIYATKSLKLNPGYRSLLVYIFTAALVSGFLYVSRNWDISKWLLIVVAAIITLSILAGSRLLGLRSLILQPTNQ